VWFDETKATSVSVGQQRRLTNAGFESRRESLWLEDTRILAQSLRHRNARAEHRQMIRRLQEYVRKYNSTHYTDGSGIYPNIIVDLNSTHFSDGTSFWPFSIFSHNGTHVFDKYFRWNATHFTDGIRFYPYTKYATNGTHITNGEFLFDGVTISPLETNKVVASVQESE
jgi:hypothetical protein